MVLFAEEQGLLEVVVSFLEWLVTMLSECSEVLAFLFTLVVPRSDDLVGTYQLIYCLQVLVAPLF